MRIFTADTIARLVAPRRWIDTMEQALIAAQGDQYLMPPRPHYEYRGNTLLLMPCFLPEFFATKLVSVFPENLQRGLPAVQGTLILNDGTTGEPLALFNGGQLTALRTGAVGGVGIRHLAPPDRSVLGVVGAGVQGMHQALMACQERKIETIWVYDPSAAQVERFSRQLGRWLPEVKIQSAASAEMLVNETQVVITATTACQPVLPDNEKLLAGKTFVAIGSFKPDMQELPNGLFRLAEQVFCDTEHGLEETGDLINPLRAGILKKSQVIAGGRLISGEVSRLAGKVQIWKSVGMALFDLYAAVMLYREALRQDAGQSVEV